MNVFVIYRQSVSLTTGEVEQIELIECDQNEQAAARFVKLYNLQIPHDLRNIVSYHYLPAYVS